ncbi:MAG TPA: proton-conducting transporter membrane subunit [Caulobacterales bacterium]|nr:proton-conducting transporter membrane subunit [Caulobacterales bacterium]
MSAHLLLAAALLAPLLHASLVYVLPKPPGLRDVIHIGFSVALAGVAFAIVGAVSHGAYARIVIARPLPHVDLAFSIEPLGALMAAAMAGLGVVHAVHTSGMARAQQDQAPHRLMAMIALASGMAMAAAFSANLFTFFVASQALALVTFPLAAHGGDEEAHRRARAYLAPLLVASVGLLLPAMVWTYARAGTLEFHPGGVLAGRVDPIAANVLLLLFVFGIASAAVPPLHRWLTNSSEAGYSALVSIQATAVLPIGVMGLIKISAYVLGPVLREAQIAERILLVLAAVSMCVAALIALSKQDLRERLAYSVLAQSMAAVIGALLALPAGLFAAALQLVALMCAASTLMMAAGVTYAATGRRDAWEYAGLGRLMPWTFAAFALGAASLVGMPPFSGAWAKLWLITASSDAGLPWAAALAGLAAVLTFAHLGPLTANAIAAPAPPDAFKRADGASILLVAPVVLSGLATLLLLVIADPLSRFLGPLWGVTP